MSLAGTYKYILALLGFSPKSVTCSKPAAAAGAPWPATAHAIAVERLQRRNFESELLSLVSRSIEAPDTDSTRVLRHSIRQQILERRVPDVRHVRVPLVVRMRAVGELAGRQLAHVHTDQVLALRSMRLDDTGDLEVVRRQIRIVVPERSELRQDDQRL